MRAALDEDQAARIERLRSAHAMASRAGQRRPDLALRVATSPNAAFFRVPERPAKRERSANAPLPNVRHDRHTAVPRGGHRDHHDRAHHRSLHRPCRQPARRAHHRRQTPATTQARAVYNAMIDKYPDAIAKCRDTADVVACVRFARAHDVEMSVRSGGHNAAGLGIADGALVIDLSHAAQHDRRPRAPHRSRRRRLHLGRRRPRDRRLRNGHPVRLPRLDRRRRPHPRRRHRLPFAPLRAHRRQPALRRRRPRRRHLRHCLRTTRTATCSGRFAAAAATSASSPRSRSAPTTSATTARSSAARCSTTWTTPPR